jgi:iron complex outermembrane recepter protein
VGSGNVNRRSRGNSPLPTVPVLIAVALAEVIRGGQESAADTAEVLQPGVITASNRTSTAQDTRISVTAITRRDIEDRGIPAFTALAQSVPGISMRSRGPGQTELEMRGVTSGGGNSAGVGFHLDDVPLSAPAAAQNVKVVIDPDLYHLNLVEVPLRVAVP